MKIFKNAQNKFNSLKRYLYSGLICGFSTEKGVISYWRLSKVLG